MGTCVTEIGHPAADYQLGGVGIELNGYLGITLMIVHFPLHALRRRLC